LGQWNIRDGSFESRQIGIAASQWSHPFFQRNSIESVFKYQGRWLRQNFDRPRTFPFRFGRPVPPSATFGRWNRKWLSAAEVAPMRIPSKDHDHTLTAPFLGALSAAHGEKGPIVRTTDVKHISKTGTETTFSRGSMESP
jgi:hypothetical protein